MATTYTQPTRNTTAYTSPEKSDIVLKRSVFDIAVFDTGTFDSPQNTYDPVTYPSKN